MTGAINHQEDCVSMVVDKSIASVIHQHLVDGGHINNDYVIKDLGRQIAIPVQNPNVITELDWFDEEKLHFATIILEPKKSTNTPAQEIAIKLGELLVANSLTLTQEMVNFLPKKWELFSDLAILPSDCLNSREWQDLWSKNEALSAEVWQIIASS